MDLDVADLRCHAPAWQCGRGRSTTHPLLDDEEDAGNGATWIATRCARIDRGGIVEGERGG